MRYRYPARKYLGIYEKWLLVLYGPRKLRRDDAELEQFLSKFPSRICIDQFTVTDIAEYVAQSKDIPWGKHKLQKNLDAVSRWFEFLITHKQLKLYNPVKPYLVAPEKREAHFRSSPIKLSEFKKLYSCADHHLKEYLLARVLRERIDRRNPVFQSTKWVANSLRQAKERAGLPDFTMEKLRKAISFGLWRELIKDYAEIFGREMDKVKNGDSLLYEAQVPRDLWGHVQFAATDVWPTVGHDHYRDPQVEWVT